MQDLTRLSVAMKGLAEEAVRVQDLRQEEADAKRVGLAFSPR